MIRPCYYRIMFPFKTKFFSTEVFVPDSHDVVYALPQVVVEVLIARRGDTQHRRAETRTGVSSRNEMLDIIRAL